MLWLPKLSSERMVVNRSEFQSRPSQVNVLVLIHGLKIQICEGSDHHSHGGTRLTCPMTISEVDVMS